MTIKELGIDLIHRYMLLGPYWQLFTYVITMLFMIGVVQWGQRKRIQASRCVLIVILFFYLITVYVSTVIVRSTMPIAFFRLEPFLSWRRALTGRKYYILIVVENIIMLMPIGVIGPFIMGKNNYIVKTITLGFFFSLFIEFSQYIFKTGLFEVDDLINNTLGVFLCAMFSGQCKKVFKRKQLKKR